MDAAPPEPQVVDVDAVPAAVVRGVVPMSELGAFFDRAFPLVAAALAAQGVTPSGAAFARYHGPPGEVADLEVGFPTSAPVAPAGEVGPGSLPGGRVARVVHRGGYDGLGASWERLRSWIDAQVLTAGTDLWEVYLTEPTPEADPADMRTELNWSLAG